MNTEVIRIDPNKLDSAGIKIAAEKIKNGRLVAFPTETVYGLGADAFNSRAIIKIFKAKKRPFDDPLIVHIAEKNQLDELVENFSGLAKKLTDIFWPGPLTLVLNKTKKLSDKVSAGLDTVAVRMPANEVALSLLKNSETPIAAPSANSFGRPSATCAQHVLDDLGGRIDLIIDAGRTTLGVESTIVDLTQHPPLVLRPGGVSIEDLKREIKEIQIYAQDKILSPGMYAQHYSPQAKVMLVGGSGLAQVEKVKRLVSSFNPQKFSVGVLAKKENINEYEGCKVKAIGTEKHLEACAANLFYILREFDREGIDIIIAENLKREGLGLAIENRLIKATGGNNVF